MRRRVPRDQRLPHVVVGEVAVLVVRGIEVGEVEAPELARERSGIASSREPDAAQQSRRDELQPLVRALRPLLDEGHLHPDGRVDPVSRFDEAGEEHRLERSPRVALPDRVADGVDPLSVERLEEPGLPAERLGDVASGSGERVQVRQRVRELAFGQGRRVRLDVAAGEDFGVAREIDSGHVHPEALERLGDPGRAGEQVQRAPGAARRADRLEHGHEPSLGSEVLDHVQPTAGPRTT